MTYTEELCTKIAKDLLIAKLSGSNTANDSASGKAIGEMFSELYTKLLDVYSESK